MLWHKGHVVKGQGHGGSERSQDKDYWLSTHREGSDAQRLGRVRSLRLVPWVAYDVAAHEFADFFHRFSFHRLVPVVFGGVTRFEKCHGVIPRSAPRASVPSLSDEHAKCDRLAARWNSCAAFPQSTHSEQQEQWADRTVHIIVHIIVGQTSGALRHFPPLSALANSFNFTAPTRRTAPCSATIWPLASPEAVATVPRSRSTGASGSAGCAQEPPDGCQWRAQPVKRIIIRGSRPV
jgi:hypothetical protein